MPETFPIAELLVPERVPIDPASRTIEQALDRGLPHSIVLPDGLKVLLVLPNGDARRWRDADPLTVLTESRVQNSPVPPAPGAAVIPEITTVPLLAVIRRGKRLCATLAVTNSHECLVDAGMPGSPLTLALQFLDWRVCAGQLRGAGDFGGFIKLAWRRTDQALAHYSTPPVNPYLLPRLQPQYRLASSLGVQHAYVLARFSTRQSFFKWRVQS